MLRKSSQMNENGSDAAHSSRVASSVLLLFRVFVTFGCSAFTSPFIILIKSRCSSRSCSPCGSAWPRESHSCDTVQAEMSCEWLNMAVLTEYHAPRDLARVLN